LAVIKMVDKPIFCTQAFGSVCINASGRYIPCCNVRMNEWDSEYRDGTEYSSIIDNANNSGLRRLRKELSDGIYPDVCKNCSEAEENGFESMRTIWNRELADYDIPVTEVLHPENVYYLDTTFSTKCNSKCMTCNPSASDFWEKEHNYIWNTNFSVAKRVNIDDDKTTELINTFPNVVRVSFVGGEPTISEEHLNYLQQLVDLGKSKDMKISYVTNLTGITDELLSLWKNFKSVHVAVSIDGYEKVNEYIRYPFKWAKVDSTLRSLFERVQNSIGATGTEFTAGLSCTVSLYNAIQCFDLFEYWFDLSTQYSVGEGQTLATHGSVFVNYVTHPSYAMVGYLSPEYRNNGIVKGESLLRKIEDYRKENPMDHVNEGMINSIKLAIEWLKEPQIHNTYDLTKLQHFINSSDKFRNRNIKDYIPELHEELEKLWNTQT